MTKPLVILDQHFRKRDELFRAETYAALSELCDIRGGLDAPMPRDELLALLPEACVYIASKPELSAGELASAPKLRATIEVAGAFRDGLDYEGCFERGIEVLSCAPGFRQAVAEMALGMMIAGARGIVDEHEAFRHGTERWLDDREERDFTLHGAPIGFVGYGQISRETHRLLAPFAPDILAHDPYVSAAPDVTFMPLTDVVQRARILVVAAVPSRETEELINAELIAQIRPGAVVILISRSWCVDFPALVQAAQAGQFTLATDVFPDEPLSASDPLRQAPNIILSPHRAAAVPGGRQLIGDMILHDIQAMIDGTPDRQLKRAEPAQVAGLVDAQERMNKMAGT